MDAATWMDQFECAAAVSGRAQGMPYMAVCFECTPVAAGPVPMTYAGEPPRDQWAQQHAGLSGHRVERYNSDAEGMRCLPAVLPPRPRLGAAVTSKETQ